MSKDFNLYGKGNPECTTEPFKRKQKQSQIILHLFLWMRKHFIV